MNFSKNDCLQLSPDMHLDSNLSKLPNEKHTWPRDLFPTRHPMKGHKVRLCDINGSASLLFLGRNISTGAITACDHAKFSHLTL